MRSYFFAVVMSLFVLVPAFGDVVILKNGSKYQGVILDNTPSEVRIRTDLGTVAFDRSKVASVEITPAQTRPDPTAHLGNWEVCIAAFAGQKWGGEIEQIPATVVDKGVLRFVPYMSTRSGDYEMNVYGDPASPACVEIGVYGKLVDDSKAKANCKNFIKAILGKDGDKKVVDNLKVDQDSVDVDGYTFEVTPPTAEDAYGGWWISVYSTKMLDVSRASEKELESIAVARDKSPATKSAQSPQNDGAQGWSTAELAKARRPAASVTPSPSAGRTTTGLPSSGGLVYVRGYTKKDGTYVQSYERRAPTKK